jgi:hypothetical protein
VKFGVPPHQHEVWVWEGQSNGPERVSSRSYGAEREATNQRRP